MKKSFGFLKLRFRYLCRKAGISKFQIHQVCLAKHKLIYIPLPKNACTSIKQALHEIEFGKPFDATLDEFRVYDEIHDYYLKRPNAFTGKKELETLAGYTRFAVVRDPVKRLLSCYRNRVLDSGDLNESRKTLRRKGLSAQPDLDSFIMNLDQYRKINSIIEHHSRPQSAFLDGSLRYFDKIYRMKDLGQLFDLLKKQKRGLAIRQRKTGGTEVGLENLSEGAFEKLLEFYRDDYKLLKEYYSEESIRQKYESVKKRS